MRSVYNVHRETRRKTYFSLLMYVYALLWQDTLKIHGLFAEDLEGGEVTDSSVEHMRMKEISFAIRVIFFFILSMLLSFYVTHFKGLDR